MLRELGGAEGDAKPAISWDAGRCVGLFSMSPERCWTDHVPVAAKSNEHIEAHRSDESRFSKTVAVVLPGNRRYDAT